MNYLLHGADTFRSRQKLREIIAEYKRKHADASNLHSFDAAEDDPAQFVAAAVGNTLFEAKKFIVLERLFTHPFSERAGFTAPRRFEIVKSVLAETHKKPGVLIVVWDEALDAEGKKRLKETEKYFDKKQKFVLLAGVALRRWVREEADRRGVALTPADAAALAMLGSDLWRVSNEMEKIAVGGSSAEAPAGARTASVFDLGDAFFSSPIAGRRILLSLLSAGEDEMRLFVYLAGHARTTLIVKSYLERGGAVPAAAKIHPFVVKKAAAAARTHSRADLERTLARFLKEDTKIKTGVSTARDSLLSMLN